ncbi:MAG: heparinase II/III-family protein [Deltaproteobacteria bacterium]|nr:heparinase II/III-family protein [Deltaproteobacteria bacterium]
MRRSRRGSGRWPRTTTRISSTGSRSSLQFSRTNHHTKVAAAFGLAGMTLNQRGDALKWVSYGMTRLADDLLGHQIVGDGAYAEGPYYGMYSALQHLPFYLAYDRLVGADEQWMRRTFCLLGPDCDWEPVTIVNPLDDARLLGMSDWYLKIRLPNGGMAPYDDSNLSGFFNGLLVGPTQDPFYAWDWLTCETDLLFARWTNGLEVEAIAFFDDSVTPAAPDAEFGKSFYLPDSGIAVFRSGWEPEDTWAMMIAEGGPPRTHAPGHDHADNLSVSFYARGEYLLIDPGYIKWDERDKVRFGHHHNVPTVDGYGPPAPLPLVPLGGADAFFLDGQTQGPIPFAYAESDWRDAHFERVMFFPEEDYLVVLDVMTSETPRTFGVLWHGLAGGETGDPFGLLADGAYWEPGDAGVEVHVAWSGEGLDVEETTSSHGFAYGEDVLHSVLDAHAQEPATEAVFLSVILPYVPDDEVPRKVTGVPVKGGAAVRVEGKETVFVFAQPTNERRRFTKAQTGGARSSRASGLDFSPQRTQSTQREGKFLNAEIAESAEKIIIKVQGTRDENRATPAAWFRFDDQLFAATRFRSSVRRLATR